MLFLSTCQSVEPRIAEKLKNCEAHCIKALHLDIHMKGTGPETARPHGQT